MKRIFDSVDDEVHDNFWHVILDALPHNVEITLDQELDNRAFSFFTSVLREIEFIILRFRTSDSPVILLIADFLAPIKSGCLQFM